MKLVILEFVGVTKFCCFVSGGGRGRVFGFLGSGGGGLLPPLWWNKEGKAFIQGYVFMGKILP